MSTIASVVFGFVIRTRWSMAGVAALAASGCNSGDGALPARIECVVTAPTECLEPSPTYADVAPIFQQRCVTCHMGVPNGPWSLSDWDHIASWKDIVRSEVLNCTMPPPDSGMTMPNEERAAILNWIRCGAPR